MIERRSRGLDLSQIQSRFSGRTFEAAKPKPKKDKDQAKVDQTKQSDDDDEDFDPEENSSRDSGSMEEELLTNQNHNDRLEESGQGPKTIDPSMLTTKDIMILEGEEGVEAESQIEDSENDSDSEGSDEDQSQEEEEDEDNSQNQDQPVQRKRLLKNKEFREKKREVKAEKRQERERQRMIKMAKLKKKMKDLIESEAELGETDEEGNEVVKQDSDDDSEDEGFDFELEDIEGLIDNVNVEGDEENAREAFRLQMLNEDNKLLKKILEGNYLSNRKMQTKLSKDKLLQDRVRYTFLAIS